MTAPPNQFILPGKRRVFPVPTSGAILSAFYLKPVRESEIAVKNTIKSSLKTSKNV